jgi:hypothetical protein
LNQDFPMNSEQDAENNVTPIYEAYLVRLWQDGPDAPLRASATAVHGGKTVCFATLQALFSFLQARSAPVRPSNGKEL